MVPIKTKNKPGTYKEGKVVDMRKYVIIDRVNLQYYQRILRKLKTREKEIFLMVSIGDLSELFDLSCAVRIVRYNLVG